MVTVSTSRNHHSLVLVFSLCDTNRNNNSSSCCCCSSTNLTSRLSEPSTSAVTWQVDREEEGFRLPVVAGSWQPKSDHLLPSSSSSSSPCCSTPSSPSSCSTSSSSSFSPSSSSSSKRHYLKIQQIASVPEIRFRSVAVKGKEGEEKLYEGNEDGDEGKCEGRGVKAVGGRCNIFAIRRRKGLRQKKESRSGWKLGFLRAVKLRNAHLVTLLSGAVGGAVSRTAVAPLETIRTHLMVGSAGSTAGEVFHHIMHTEGWKGLFRGNGINVIRIAPSKAIEIQARQWNNI